MSFSPWSGGGGRRGGRDEDPGAGRAPLQRAGHHTHAAEQHF